MNPPQSYDKELWAFAAEARGELAPGTARTWASRAKRRVLGAPAQIQLSEHPAGWKHIKSSLKKIGELIESGSHDWQVRQLATAITAPVPSKNPTAEIAAIYNWVRKNIRYRYDPLDLEMLQSATRTVKERAGDCDCLTILIGSLCRSIGHNVLIRAVGSSKTAPEHVSAVVFDRQRWINCDPVLEPSGNITGPGTFAAYATGPATYWNVKGKKMLGSKPTLFETKNLLPGNAIEAGSLPAAADRRYSHEHRSTYGLGTYKGCRASDSYSYLSGKSDDLPIYPAGNDLAFWFSIGKPLKTKKGSFLTIIKNFFRLSDPPPTGKVSTHTLYIYHPDSKWRKNSLIDKDKARFLYRRILAGKKLNFTEWAGMELLILEAQADLKDPKYIGYPPLFLPEFQYRWLHGHKTPESTNWLNKVGAALKQYAPDAIIALSSLIPVYGPLIAFAETQAFKIAQGEKLDLEELALDAAKIGLKNIPLPPAITTITDTIKNLDLPAGLDLNQIKTIAIDTIKDTIKDIDLPAGLDLENIDTYKQIYQDATAGKDYAVKALKKLIKIAKDPSDTGKTVKALLTTAKTQKSKAPTQPTSPKPTQKSKPIDQLPEVKDMAANIETLTKIALADRRAKRDLARRHAAAKARIEKQVKAIRATRKIARAETVKLLNTAKIKKGKISLGSLGLKPTITFSLGYFGDLATTKAAARRAYDAIIKFTAAKGKPPEWPLNEVRAFQILDGKLARDGLYGPSGAAALKWYLGITPPPVAIAYRKYPITWTPPTQTAPAPAPTPTPAAIPSPTPTPTPTPPPSLTDAIRRSAQAAVDAVREFVKSKGRPPEIALAAVANFQKLTAPSEKSDGLWGPITAKRAAYILAPQTVPPVAPAYLRSDTKPIPSPTPTPAPQPTPTPTPTPPPSLTDAIKRSAQAAVDAVRAFIKSKGRPPEIALAAVANFQKLTAPSEKSDGLWGPTTAKRAAYILAPQTVPPVATAYLRSTTKPIPSPTPPPPSPTPTPTPQPTPTPAPQPEPQPKPQPQPQPQPKPPSPTPKPKPKIKAADIPPIQALIYEIKFAAIRGDQALCQCLKRDLAAKTKQATAKTKTKQSNLWPLLAIVATSI